MHYLTCPPITLHVDNSIWGQQLFHLNCKESESGKLTKMIRSGKRRQVSSRHVAINPKTAALRKITGIPTDNTLSRIFFVLMFFTQSYTSRLPTSVVTETTMYIHIFAIVQLFFTPFSLPQYHFYLYLVW